MLEQTKDGTQLPPGIESRTQMQACFAYGTSNRTSGFRVQLRLPHSGYDHLPTSQGPRQLRAVVGTTSNRWVACLAKLLLGERITGNHDAPETMLKP